MSDASAVSVVDNSGATTTRPVQSGSSDPATCVAGKDMFINTAGTPVLKLCSVTNVWGTVGGGGVGGGGVNAQTVSYVLLAGDAGKLVTENGSGLTAWLPPSPPSVTWYAAIQNLNATALTVSRNGLLINGGASNITLQQYQWTYCYTDGANYFCKPPVAAGSNVTLTMSAVAETIASTGGGGGATSGLQQFDMTKTSATIATLCSTCLSSTPGIIMNNGILAAAITAPATATISGTVTSGTIFFYLADGNIPTIAHNTTATITGSAGWTVATGVAAIPRNAVATFWEITFTANVIDTIVPATMDIRGIQNQTVDGAGLSSVRDGATGDITRSTDPNSVPRYFSGSGTPTVAGFTTCSAARDFYWDTTGLIIYGCDATNTWKAINLIEQNSQSAAYTTLMSDAGRQIYHPGADTTARTFTIDSNAHVPYPLGACITFINDTSAGIVTIAITSDTLVLAGAGTTGSRTLSASGMATACKTTTVRWMISGNGLT